MSSSKLIRRYRRSARDFAVGFAGFSAFALAGLVSPDGLVATSAHARRFEEEPLPLIGDAAQALAGAIQLPAAWSGGRQLMVMLVLALAFASIFALNLWFARHVRRVHASSRRR